MTARRTLALVAIATTVAAIAGTLAWNAGPRLGSVTAAEKGKPAARPLELIAAELQTLAPRDLVETVRFTGTTQPVDQSIVKSRVSGRLADVRVREGDRVIKDQVLATFERAELEARAHERRAALEAARAKARWATRDRTDKEALAARNVVSAAAADQARAVADAKSSLVAVSEAQLDIALRNLADAEIRAPFGGTVGERFANPGESLPIDGRVLALLDTSRVEIAAQIPAVDVVRLRVGQTANATIEGFDERTFTARISRISPTAPAGSRTIPVFVEILGAPDALRGGLFGTGSVTVAEASRALAVPASAIRRDDAGEHVLVVEGDTLARKPVTAVRTWQRGELVEVGGLAAGAIVVAAPLPGLKPGQKVVIVGPARKT